MTDDVCIADALSLLAELGAEAAEPEIALRRLGQLRGRHPGRVLELVWDRPPFGPIGYTILIGVPGRGVLSVALSQPGGVPLPLRGAQRASESELVRIDGRPFRIHEAMVVLDALWDDVRILDRIVELCLVRRLLERDPVVIDDSELQRAMDAHRAERGLFTAAATEAWLARQGFALGGLEALVEEQLAMRHLRRRLVGAEAEAAYRDMPGSFDRVAISAFPADGVVAAEQWVAAIRGGSPFLAVAEQALIAAAGAAGTASLRIQTVDRHELEAIGGDTGQVAPGGCLVARIEGAGPYVVGVRAVAEAAWDAATRDRVERWLFARHVASLRAGAHIEWNWGGAD